MCLRKLSLILCLVLVSIVSVVPDRAFAVNPDEVLQDNVLENRARHLSSIIRCMKCQNQSIDDSDADLAKDLRILVRDRLTKGDSDQQVLDYLVDRYGEFVLLKPSFSNANLFLWFAPFLALLAGLFFSWRLMRRRKTSVASDFVPGSLSKTEHDALAKILDDRD